MSAEFELGDAARARWAQTISEIFSAAGYDTQRSVLNDLDEGVRVDAAQLSRFCKAHADTLRRWFGKSGKAAHLEELLNQPAGTLRRRLDGCRSVKAVADQWHPDFAFVSIEQMRISTPVVSGKGRMSVDAFIDEFLAGRSAMRHPKQPRIYVVGEPGSGRDTLAEQLKVSWEGRSGGRVLIVDNAESADANTDGVAGLLTVLPDGHTPLGGHEVVQPAPWGATELRELLEKLVGADALSPGQLGAGERWLSKVEAGRATLGLLRGPRSQIALLARALRGENMAEAAVQQAATQGSWLAARAAESTLRWFGDSFPIRFWGAWWQRSKRLPWFEMTRADAASLVSEAIGRPPAAPRILEMVAALRTSSARKRGQAIDLLERALHGDDAERLVEYLVASGWLEPSPRDMALLRPARPDEALAATAWFWGRTQKQRAIVFKSTASTARRTFLDFATTLARVPCEGGGSTQEADHLVRAAWSAPLAARVDACRGAVVFLAERDGALDALAAQKQCGPALVSVWATALWSQTVRLLGYQFPRPHYSRAPEPAALSDALTRISRALDRQLPALGFEHQMTQLIAHVPSKVQRLAGEHPRPLEQPAPEWFQDSIILRLAPAQCMPSARSDWDRTLTVWGQRLGRHVFVEADQAVLERRAKRGDEHARALISGEGYGRLDRHHPWRDLSTKVQLRWLGMADDDPRSELARWAAVTTGMSPSLDETVETFRRRPAVYEQAMEAFIAGRDWCDPWSPPLVESSIRLLEVARALRAHGVLNQVMELPSKWLAKLQLKIDPYSVQLSARLPRWPHDLEFGIPVPDLSGWQRADRGATRHGSPSIVLRALDQWAGAAAVALYTLGDPHRHALRVRAQVAPAITEEQLPRSSRELDDWRRTLLGLRRKFGLHQRPTDAPQPAVVAAQLETWMESAHHRGDMPFICGMALSSPTQVLAVRHFEAVGERTAEAIWWTVRAWRDAGVDTPQLVYKILNQPGVLFVTEQETAEARTARLDWVVFALTVMAGALPEDLLDETRAWVESQETCGEPITKRLTRAIRGDGLSGVARRSSVYRYLIDERDPEVMADLAGGPTDHTLQKVLYRAMDDDPSLRRRAWRHAKSPTDRRSLLKVGLRNDDKWAIQALARAPEFELADFWIDKYATEPAIAPLVEARLTAALESDNIRLATHWASRIAANDPEHGLILELLRPWCDRLVATGVDPQLENLSLEPTHEPEWLHEWQTGGVESRLRLVEPFAVTSSPHPWLVDGLVALWRGRSALNDESLVSEKVIELLISTGHLERLRPDMERYLREGDVDYKLWRLVKHLLSPGRAARLYLERSPVDDEAFLGLALELSGQERVRWVDQLEAACQAPESVGEENRFMAWPMEALVAADPDRALKVFRQAFEQHPELRAELVLELNGYAEGRWRRTFAAGGLDISALLREWSALLVTGSTEQMGLRDEMPERSINSPKGSQGPDGEAR